MLTRGRPKVKVRLAIDDDSYSWDDMKITKVKTPRNVTSNFSIPTKESRDGTGSLHPSRIRISQKEEKASMQKVKKCIAGT